MRIAFSALIGLAALLFSVLPCMGEESKSPVTDMHSMPGEEVARLTAAVLHDMSERDSRPLTGISYDVAETARQHDYGFRVTRRPSGLVYKLATVDAQPATAEQTAKFTKTHAATNTAEKARQCAFGSYLKSLKPGTLTFLRREAGKAVFSCVCFYNTGGEKPEELKGTLYFDEKEGYVTSIDLVNQRAFKPDFRVKIDVFKVHMDFGRNEALGRVVPLSMSSHLEGRILMVKNLVQDYKASYSDYRTAE
jgi:hypothetical protein